MQSPIRSKSPWPSSTPSSAISPATPPSCARPAPRPPPRAPTSSSSPSCSSPAIRPRTWCASRPSPPRRAPSWRRWPPRPPTAAPASSSAPSGPRTASSTTPSRCSTAAASQAVRYKVDLPNYGVFDEKRVFDAGPHAGSDRLPRRAHRRADLRGHLEGRGVRVPAGDGLGDADLAQRLALRLAQARPAHERRRRARDRDRAAAALSQPGRRPGRAGVRRRLLRAQCRPSASPCRCRPGRRRVTVVEMRRTAGRLALRSTASAPCIEEQECRRLSRLRAGPARLRRQERLSRRRAGAVGRHRLRARRRPGGRCAGARARALRDAALPLHLQREPRRCRGLRQGAGRALRHRADRRAGRGLPRQVLEPDVRGPQRPTSPRRTSRAACAAPR